MSPKYTHHRAAKRGPVSGSHHLDRRAQQLAEAGDGDDDELLPTPALAAWFGVSIQWLEIGRSRGYGPPFRRIGPKMIRYRRGDALRWLDERMHASTAEYAIPDAVARSPGRPRSKARV